MLHGNLNPPAQDDLRWRHTLVQLEHSFMVCNVKRNLCSIQHLLVIVLPAAHARPDPH